MPIKRINVNDYKALGNLFIDWALGNVKPPTDLPGFIKAVVDTEIVAPLPDYIIDFKPPVQSTKEVLLLRLPPAELVQDTLDNLGKQPYFFPPFYDDRINGRLPNDRDFFGFRVGDYTI